MTEETKQIASIDMIFSTHEGMDDFLRVIPILNQLAGDDVRDVYFFREFGSVVLSPQDTWMMVSAGLPDEQMQILYDLYVESGRKSYSKTAVAGLFPRLRDLKPETEGIEALPKMDFASLLDVYLTQEGIRFTVEQSSYETFWKSCASLLMMNYNVTRHALHILNGSVPMPTAEEYRDALRLHGESTIERDEDLLREVEELGRKNPSFRFLAARGSNHNYLLRTDTGNVNVNGYLNTSMEELPRRIDRLYGQIFLTRGKVLDEIKDEEIMGAVEDIVMQGMNDYKRQNPEEATRF